MTFMIMISFSVLLILACLFYVSNFLDDLDFLVSTLVRDGVKCFAFSLPVDYDCKSCDPAMLNCGALIVFSTLEFEFGVVNNLMKRI